MADLALAVKIGGEDRFSGPAAKIGGAAGKLSKRLSAAKAELEGLGKQKAALATLAKLEQGLGKSAAAMEKAERRTERLRGELAATDSPAKKLSASFERAKTRSDKLASAHEKQQSRLSKLRDELRKAGIDTERLGNAQAELERKMQRSSQATDRLRSANDALAARRAESARSRERLAHSAMALDGAADIGRAAMRGLAAPMRMARGLAAARGDLQSLGLSPEAAQAISDRGLEVSLEVPGTSPEDFTAAAYDIQSGIDGLTTEGIADLTEASAVTARGTKSEVADMTDLMKTLHGVFRGSQYAEASDTEFGWAAAGQLSAAVNAFATTGPKMKQAIESAGADMTLQGVSMAEQFAASGILQGMMPAERAGTALRAVALNVNDAETKLAAGGRSVRLTSDDGNMLPLTRMMENLRQEFGAEFTGDEQAEVAKAFGVEAKSAIAGLWDKRDRHEAGVATLEAGADALGGERLARAMQAARDNNADVRLALLQSRWEKLMLTVGEDLIGAMAALAPAIEPVIDGFQWLADEFPAASVVGAAVAGLTVAAGIAAKSLLTLAFAAREVRDWRAERSIARDALGPRSVPKSTRPGGPGRTPRGFFGRFVDAARRIAPRVPAPGRLGKLAPLAKGAASFASKGLGTAAMVGLGAVELGSAVLDKGPRRSERIAEAGGGVAGALGGGLAGAKLGALIGTAVFPGAGTAIGGLLGGAIGALAGDSGGRSIASWLHGENPVPAEAAPAPDQAAFVGPLPEAAASAGKTVSIGDVRIDVHPRPGEDDEALARRVLEQFRRLVDDEGQEAAFDAS